MCFVNAVLQLLVHLPPFWNLFKELADLKGQRGAWGPETGGGATPLADATVRFFEEFIFKEKEPPSMPQRVQMTARRKAREGEEEKEENKVMDSFDPMYMYDAMREKRRLKNLLVCPYAQDALFCC
jgi:ubiquitin carboxyl-terminal hydrolase 10